MAFELLCCKGLFLADKQPFRENDFDYYSGRFTAKTSHRLSISGETGLYLSYTLEERALTMA